MDRVQVCEDWIDFLETQKWTQFATFTTKKPITLKSARRLMAKVAVRVLRRDEKLFWAAEKFELGREGYHLHALITTRHSANQIEKWYSEKYGRCVVSRYNPKRGAAAYVAKYLLKRSYDYDMLIGKGETELFEVEGKARQ